jgi:hypothetical protein
VRGVKKGKATLSDSWKQVKDRERMHRLNRRMSGLNVDAAFDPFSGIANLGMVFRDHTRKVLLSALKHGSLRAVEDAEAKACLKTVYLITECIRKPTVIELL